MGLDSCIIAFPMYKIHFRSAHACIFEVNLIIRVEGVSLRFVTFPCELNIMLNLIS